MFDLAFLDVMRSRPSLLPQGSAGQYGKRVYGDPVVMAAYWQDGGSTMEASSGGSSNREGKLWIAPAAYWPTPWSREPSTDDGLLLPDGTKPTVTKVTVYRDQDGVVFGTELEYA